MLTDRFTPQETECLLRAAGELANGAVIDDLTEVQQDLLGRAGDALQDDREDPAPGLQATAAQMAAQVWVLRRQDRHADEVTLWPDEATALEELAAYTRASWDNVVGLEDVPAQPPADDRQAVTDYYGPHGCRDEESYSLYADSVNAPARLAVPDAMGA